MFKIFFRRFKHRNLIMVLSGRNSLKGLPKKERARILRKQKKSIYKPLTSFFS